MAPILPPAAAIRDFIAQRRKDAKRTRFFLCVFASLRESNFALVGAESTRGAV